MNPSKQFADHIATLQERYQGTISLLGQQDVRIEAILLHSGSQGQYFGDDRPIPFQPYGHFIHWLPVRRPDQLVLVRPGEKPVYFRVQRKTYWTDETIPTESWWESEFDLMDLDEPHQVIDHLPALRHIAYMGPDPELAKRIGLPSHLHNETHLRNRLNYHRSLKTPYEVDRIRSASRVSLRAHQAARHAFEAFGSEVDIFKAYLNACGGSENDQPYEAIVALDDRSAILHYVHRRCESSEDRKVLLMDAGYADHGYAADITRTHVRDSAPAVFCRLVEQVTALKDQMIDLATAGTSFKELNTQAHNAVTRILLEAGLVTGSPDELTALKVSNLFFPHGLGHLLGLQVHDVSGLFKDETGVLEPPSHEHSNLRLTRKLEAGMVFTVEPGLYFIPMLLNPERDTDKGKHLNFDLIDELTPLGGIRVEDNVLIQQEGATNLTAEATASIQMKDET